MTDNVVPLNADRDGFLDANEVLDHARSLDLVEAVVMGYTKDGSEYFHCSREDAGPVLFLIERIKLRLLTSVDDGDIRPHTEADVVEFPRG